MNIRGGGDQGHVLLEWRHREIVRNDRGASQSVANVRVNVCERTGQEAHEPKIEVQTGVFIDSPRRRCIQDGIAVVITRPEQIRKTIGAQHVQRIKERKIGCAYAVERMRMQRVLSVAIDGIKIRMLDERANDGRFVRRPESLTRPFSDDGTCLKLGMVHEPIAVFV
ncbi:hypothetical protein [Pararobbsia alpina]|uniref:hypothetical protein n=1 Tax=Pararobbsia alpina TaxID=621374 RepID=UPI0039A4A088